MKNNRTAGLFLACIYLTIAACTPAASPPDPTQEPTIEPTQEPSAESVNDNDSGDVNDGLAGIIDALLATGQSVALGGQVDQPFFSVPGQIIVVNGEDVQVFEYSDPKAVESESDQISPDASSVGTNMMSWIATPHFYEKGRLIALYVGEDEAVIGALNQVLGQPIAQGQPAILPGSDESTADKIPTDASPQQPALSYEGAVYRNEANGFEFDYPMSWSFEEEVYGVRGSGAQFSSEGEFALSAVVYLWDPKNDLDSYADRWRQGWAASNIPILSEEELTLAGGLRAIQFEIEEVDGQQKYIMFTEVGDRYLELSGSGDLNLLSEIAQTLRPVDVSTIEPITGLAAFENELAAAITSRDLVKMQALMDETFGFAFWGSEGYPASSEEAIEQIEQNYISSDQTINFDVVEPDLSDILGPQTILGVWDPAHNPVDALFSTGWGQDGQDEAFLIIIQKQDNSYAWDGIVLASGSYGGFIGLYAPSS